MMSKAANPSNNQPNWLAVDVGTVRIGVARASAAARLAEPLVTLPVDGNEITSLEALIQSESAGTIIVGLPRGLDGQDTAQTALTRQFIDRLKSLSVKIVTTDEAGTSVEAERILAEKPRPHWSHEGVDAVAAMIILNDYLETHEV